MKKLKNQKIEKNRKIEKIEKWKNRKIEKEKIENKYFVNPFSPRPKKPQLEQEPLKGTFWTVLIDVLLKCLSSKLKIPNPDLKTPQLEQEPKSGSFWTVLIDVLLNLSQFKV